MKFIVFARFIWKKSLNYIRNKVMENLDKIKKRVLNKRPWAKVRREDDGEFYIDDDGINLTEEHLLPPAYDEYSAWINADISLKYTQNFNRTHPLRTEAMDDKKKKGRINRRMMDGEVDKRTKKSGGYSSYDTFD